MGELDVTAATLAGGIVQPSRLIDQYGRVHTDLRVSLTDRCSLRCVYCVPAGGQAGMPRRLFLDRAEIVRLARVATGLGITKIRLTGGEPLVRRDAVAVVAGLANLAARPRIALTTNGLRLAELAGRLAEAGLTRVNVSLDSLDRDRYARLTGRDGLGQALAGIDAAARLMPVKINAVLMRGHNDDEACRLLEFALARGCELRFIEQMPLGDPTAWRRSDLVTADEVLERLSTRHTLMALPESRQGAPAERYLVDGGPAVVGVIASVTRPFCGDCSRLRLTADGQLRSCLFAHTEADLRSALRDGASDLELARAMIACVATKAPGHKIGRSDFRPPDRLMRAIGG
ncbi:MAG: GTP 3',8-cyclase MoaA [Bifidobacteriaceae bacterium]|jgi:cyclic pyranopterin phosphate synthase|nr:GTP 3',8-cyclase MoaA [Bifidobacteriaceae bacterium]